MKRPEKPIRCLALMAACLLLASIGIVAHADDEPAKEAPKPTSFRAETPEHEASGEVPKEDEGFWRIPGKESWIKLGGFVMLDVIHDFDAIGSKTDFVPSTIPVDGGTKVQGLDGWLTYSFRQTRFSLDSRTKAGKGMIRAFGAIDFFGGTDDDPQLRVRQAFIRMAGLAGGGDLTIGRAWSFFMDTVALPETLDYETPAANVFTRQGLVGWSKQYGAVSFMVSVEEPSSEVEGADGLTRLPDLVAAGRWHRKWTHLKLAGIARQLRASLNDGPVATANTAGLSFSGQVIFGKRQDNSRSRSVPVKASPATSTILRRTRSLTAPRANWNHCARSRLRFLSTRMEQFPAHERGLQRPRGRQPGDPDRHRSQVDSVQRAEPDLESLRESGSRYRGALRYAGESQRRSRIGHTTADERQIRVLRQPAGHSGYHRAP